MLMQNGNKPAKNKYFFIILVFRCWKEYGSNTGYCIEPGWKTTEFAKVLITLLFNQFYNHFFISLNYFSIIGPRLVMVS
jgi:hypothetical protein